MCPENPSGHLLQESGRKHQSQLSERRYQGAIVPPDLPRINSFHRKKYLFWVPRLLGKFLERTEGVGVGGF